MADVEFENVEFENKVAIVTGAASGIGAAVARELAEKGAKVVIADLDEQAARKLASELDGALPFRIDVADPEAVETMVKFAEDRFGGLHLAVNNAGIGGPNMPLADCPIDEWRKVIAVNLDSVFYCMKFEIAAMLRSGGGAIVNMASILGSVGTPNVAGYVAAKHGVVGLTKVAALDYAQQGIRVNAVGPGYIETPILNNLEADERGNLQNLHPLGRLGTPGEVAALTCFLLSGRASFITGSFHLVDGGYTAP